MTPNDTRDAMAYVHKLYPKAATAWAEARQIAFRDQLARISIDYDQFRACAGDVAMNAKASWCPPEAELLKRLKGLVVDRGIRRAVEAPKAPVVGPDDLLLTDWIAADVANPRGQSRLSPTQLKGLAMLRRSREKRLGVMK